jgi:hypothetical protein
LKKLFLPKFHVLAMAHLLETVKHCNVCEAYCASDGDDDGDNEQQSVIAM